MEYWGFSLCPGVKEHSHQASVEHLLEQVQTAEQHGLDGWFFAEHHSDASYSLTASPNLLVAAASQTTRRLRLGNMVTVLPYHHPFRVAEEIRFLDSITGGRLDMGFGRGGFPHEQVALGLARSEVSAMFDASLELVRRFLVEDGVDYETQWWQGRGATAVPEATQRPTPPLWLGVVSDASLARAAHLGMNANSAWAYPELLRHRMDLYGDSWAQEHDNPRGKFGVLLQVIVAETEQEAIRQAKQPLQGRIDAFMKGFGAPRAQGVDPGYENRSRIHSHVSSLSFNGLLEEGLVIFGSVDQCVEQLERLRSAGVDVVTAWLQFEGLDYGFVRRSLGLLCDEVIPRVEGRASYTVTSA